MSELNLIGQENDTKTQWKPLKVFSIAGSEIAVIDKKISGQVRKAVQDYDMIREGDKIAVGISGGKDSLTLLLALRKLQEITHVKFNLEAITIDMGSLYNTLLAPMDISPVRELCAEIGVRYTIEETAIWKIVFEARNEQNPCSLCANMRRGALNNTALALGCNKVALAHNRDDVIETFVMGQFYEGRIHTFSPVTWLDRKKLHVIRPLIYTEEKDIRSFVKNADIKVVSNPCPSCGKTARETIKHMLYDMSKSNKGLKDNIFGSIRRSGFDGWHDHTKL